MAASIHTMATAQIAYRHKDWVIVIAITNPMTQMILQKTQTKISFYNNPPHPSPTNTATNKSPSSPSMASTYLRYDTLVTTIHSASNWYSTCSLVTTKNRWLSRCGFSTLFCVSFSISGSFIWSEIGFCGSAIFWLIVSIRLIVLFCYMFGIGDIYAVSVESFSKVI